jgi:creatinine amidohydrolase/Fe(II)-dependent formamide hydrolase-like protein
MIQGRADRALRGLFVAAVLAFGASAYGQTPAASVHLEEMTWPELRERIAAGTTIALVPIGGTEQNGPHMTLGKHNLRVRVLAERIARRLGNAVVAPVIAIVPEGRIEPPTEHMRWPGTLSMPMPAFEAMLESVAKSLQHAGIVDVVLLGDHGGYRGSLERVAARLPHVHALPEYYRAARVTEHAGRADTSLTLALAPQAVRPEVARARAPSAGGDGAVGDPRGANAGEGSDIAERVVVESVSAIRRALRPQSPP